MRYKVVGNHKIDGVPPGGRVKIEDEARARYLLRAGHIAAPAPKPTTETEGVSDVDPGTD